MTRQYNSAQPHPGAMEEGGETRNLFTEKVPLLALFSSKSLIYTTVAARAKYFTCLNNLRL
jgi:hypothetical protein